MHQMEAVSLDDLVPNTHSYRQFSALWSFEGVAQHLKKLEKDNAYKGYGLLRLFKCLLLQFLEDISDRELQRFLQENTAAKWFCGFGLAEKTPDYFVFSELRKRIGTKVLSNIFSDLREQLKAQGVMNEVFSFVDATHLISKAALWQERDKAIKAKYDKLNNDVLPKVAADKQARIGCKGKKKYWYGYKQHTSVDMQSGLINIEKKIVGLVTFAHLMSVRVFSKRNKRVRYRGVARNQFSAFMYAISFNLKRLVVLDPPSLALT